MAAAAAAIPTGFTELLITTRIITDIYRLPAHRTRHAEPSGSECNGADRSGSRADPSDRRLFRTMQFRVRVLSGGEYHESGTLVRPTVCTRRR